VVVQKGSPTVYSAISCRAPESQVTIWNTGDESDTYMPERLGPFITIHKTLNAKGHTTTKVLDARGHKTPLSKAEDVKRILQALSVNAANPSIVLTQDQARGLLSGDKVNRKLYDLFVESLGFDATLENLSVSDAEIKKQNGEVSPSRRVSVSLVNAVKPELQGGYVRVVCLQRYLFAGKPLVEPSIATILSALNLQAPPILIVFGSATYLMVMCKTEVEAPSVLSWSLALQQPLAGAYIPAGIDQAVWFVFKMHLSVRVFAIGILFMTCLLGQSRKAVH
jgi:hypothetical protein